MAKKKDTTQKPPARKKTEITETKKSAKSVSVKGLPGEEMRAAIRDIIGAVPKEVTIKFDEKLGPGGTRITIDEASWDGNLYKYRY